MLVDYLITILWSLSPVGEGRAGIPFGIEQLGLSQVEAFVAGLIGNLLVFPLFFPFIKFTNKWLWKHRIYKKGAIKLARRAKKGTQKSIQKYGAWGLMVFVMIPLPVTGAYMGTIGAFIFDIPYKKGLLAISVGVIMALSIITFLWDYIMMGWHAVIGLF